MARKRPQMDKSKQHTLAHLLMLRRQHKPLTLLLAFSRHMAEHTRGGRPWQQAMARPVAPKCLYRFLRRMPPILAERQTAFLQAACFPDWYTALVAWGEKNSRLSDAFQALSVLLEKQILLQQRVRRVFQAPWRILLFTWLLVLLYCWLVIPKLRAFYSVFDTPAPFGFMGSWSPGLPLLLLLGLILSIRWVQHTPAGRRTALTLPPVRRLARLLHLRRVCIYLSACRELHMATEAALDLVDALSLYPDLPVDQHRGMPATFTRLAAAYVHNRYVLCHDSYHCLNRVLYHWMIAAEALVLALFLITASLLMLAGISPLTELLTFF